MYTTSKRTSLVFSSQEKLIELSKCSSVEERFNLHDKMPDKAFSLNGFWKRESILNLARRRGFKGKIYVTYAVLNYSKPSLSYDKERFILMVAE